MARRTATKERKGRPRAARDVTKPRGSSNALPLCGEYCLELLDSASEAIIVGDSDGRIVLANRKAEEMFGYKRQELLGQPIQILLPERVRDIHAEHIKRYLANPRVRPMGPELDIAGRRKDGTEFPLECGLGYVKTEDDVLVIAVMTDITGRRDAQSALRESEALYRSLVETSPDAITLTDLNGKILVCNEQAAILHGAAGVEDMVGRDAFEFVAPEDRQRAIDNLRKTLEMGSVRNIEYTLLTVDGRRVLVELSASTVANVEGEPSAFIGVVRDIAERRRAEQVLREREGELEQLTARLLDVQEEERRAIARELHDEIGQLLTGLALTLETFVRSPRQATMERLRETQRSVEELISRVSNMSLDLRPAMLDDLGLLPALLWQFERFVSRTGVRVDFKHNGLEERLAPEVETAAYRIVQEALTNVARHAGVSEMTVRLWADRDRLLVRIEDQGTGFDPPAVLAAGHASGLAGMQERAALCGGQLSIESSPGAGTRLTVELPAGGTTKQGKR